jgi:nucleoside-diphosphate-sugar epimerase
MKILVTGANGFIGNALLKQYAMIDTELIAIIKDRNENIDSISHYTNVRIVYCGMDNYSDLINLIPDRDIDTCIHLAWAGSFGNQRSDFNLQLSNIKYSLDLIQVLGKLHVKRFIGIGTLAEKDVMAYHFQNGATPSPVSEYGISKLSLHLFSKIECLKNGVEHIWCSFSNTYGEYNTTNNFINFALKKFLTGERASFTSGEQLYDFVHISDTVNSLIAVVERGVSGNWYYLGSNNPRPLKEYILAMRDLVDSSIPLYLGEVPFDGKSLTLEDLDCSLLINQVGYSPQITFSEGIVRTIDWLKSEMENKNESQF